MKLNSITKLSISIIGALIAVIGVKSGNNILLMDIGFLLIGISIGAEMDDR